MLEYDIDDILHVSTNIFFDEPESFCGETYVSLMANKDSDEWQHYTIGITIHDEDDLDYGLLYHTNEENFEDILRELVNWMIDHENGITSVDKMYEDIFEFFPDLGCERTYW
jgi:hypothetical protein